VTISIPVKHRRLPWQTLQMDVYWPTTGMPDRLRKTKAWPLSGRSGFCWLRSMPERIDEPTADEWLSTWIDEIGYYVPYHSISECRW